MIGPPNRSVPDVQFSRRRAWRELADFEGFPSRLRNGLRAFLNAFHRMFRYERTGAELLGALLRRTGERQVVELCGGGGQFAVRVRERLMREGLDVSFLLTDLHPVPLSAQDLPDPRVVLHPVPVDAARVPSELRGARLITDAFHHFDPAVARAILEDAFQKRIPILILEATRNSLLGVVSSLFYPVLILLAAPFTRPFRWSTLFLTYVVPVYPITVSWDGLVSNLRTYSRPELLELVKGLEAPDYGWEVGQTTLFPYPGTITYLIGCPAAAGATALDAPPA